MHGHLADLWSSRILSNQGPKHKWLEQELRSVMGVRNLTLFANGTLALALGLRSLGIKGEVVTTPFTFPATPHCITWVGATPVFCDISPDTLCIDPGAVESMITPQTEAILGVHVYGMPCDVHALERIAERHRLVLAYDAAHAFLTEIDGRPIGEFGHLSMFSFHATKLFHTIEGGCLVYSDASLRPKLDLLKNFGIQDENSVLEVGLNAKLNEVQSAIGLAMINEIEPERARRAALRHRYLALLAEIAGIRCLRLPQNVTDSLQYMPIRINAKEFGLTRDEVYRELLSFNIYSRKYFFPLCSDYAPYTQTRSGTTPNAHRASEEVLCLPFYGDMGMETVDRVVEILRYLSELARVR
ncbi:MAG TPA: DegT/DnrJ/EryC1/StrS family aminotransferase [Burkholderiales bacterium]|nr:DegT/DnrJ/EryC1/StrS family aminotransferase [Burkholderiales bacterium]